ncbi:MAG: DUF434 domain-containing protein [Bacteroidota bacterium]
METQVLQDGKNRGKSSEDTALFASSKELVKLSHAAQDMYYLLSRGYAIKSSLAIVGNRHRLRARQLMALQGMSCSAKEIETRKEKELTPELLNGQVVYLDGFNVIILLETLLSGGFVFKGLDGCYRDISSVHGTYKKVIQTERALVIVGDTLKAFGVQKVVWIFDTPVSNSGRLKALCHKIALENSFEWDVFLEIDPDKYLVQDNRLAASADAWVLNHCTAWFNLGAVIIDNLYKNRPPQNVISLEV